MSSTVLSPTPRRRVVAVSRPRQARRGAQLARSGRAGLGLRVRVRPSLPSHRPVCGLPSPSDGLSTYPHGSRRLPCRLNRDVVVFVLLSSFPCPSAMSFPSPCATDDGVIHAYDWFVASSLLHPICVGSATLIGPSVSSRHRAAPRLKQFRAVVFAYLRLASNRTLAPTTVQSWIGVCVLFWHTPIRCADGPLHPASASARQSRASSCVALDIRASSRADDGLHRPVRTSAVSAPRP